jgi:hypothetical protein
LECKPARGAQRGSSSTGLVGFNTAVLSASAQRRTCGILEKAADHDKKKIVEVKAAGDLPARRTIFKKMYC